LTGRQAGSATGWRPAAAIGTHGEVAAAGAGVERGVVVDASDVVDPLGRDRAKGGQRQDGRNEAASDEGGGPAALLVVALQEHARGRLQGGGAEGGHGVHDAAEVRGVTRGEQDRLQEGPASDSATS